MHLEKEITMLVTLKIRKKCKGIHELQLSGVHSWSTSQLSGVLLSYQKHMNKSLRFSGSSIQLGYRRSQFETHAELESTLGDFGKNTISQSILPHKVVVKLKQDSEFLKGRIQNRWNKCFQHYRAVWSFKMFFSLLTAKGYITHGERGGTKTQKRYRCKDATVYTGEGAPWFL